jgi:hypothetical protein
MATLEKTSSKLLLYSAICVVPALLHALTRAETTKLSLGDRPLLETLSYRHD